jgi:hypothetical protein
VTARLSDDYLQPFTPAPQVKFRTAPQVRAAVQKILGRCPDCIRGERKNITSTKIRCQSCNGTGKLDAMSACLVAGAARQEVSKTYYALCDLRDQGVVESHTDDAGVELWRAKRR